MMITIYRQNKQLVLTFCLFFLASAFAYSQSCNDGIMNGNETGVDCGTIECGPCLTLEIEEISRELFPKVRLKIKPLANDTLLKDLTLQDFVITENDSIQTKNRVLTPPEEVVTSGSGSEDSTFLNSKLDIIFIVDNSGSMSNLQNEIQNNLDEFIDTLSSRNYDVSLGLVRYGQYTNSGNPIIEDDGILTDDLNYYQNSVFPRNIANGSIEPAFLALEMAADSFAFRTNSIRMFILVTDETPNQGSVSQEQAQNALNAVNANLFVLTTPGLFSNYNLIIPATDGGLFDIDDGFVITIDGIVSQLTNFYIFEYESCDTLVDCIYRDVNLSLNYMMKGTSDSVEYRPKDICLGCTDMTAFNYDPSANTDDGSCQYCPNQAAFITTWRTDNSGFSNSTSISIPTTGNGYNYCIDWENDGIIDEFGVTGDITHDYGTTGTYQVAIRGDFPRIHFDNSGDKGKILSIDQWGDINWSSMDEAFYGCFRLELKASDAPNLDNVTDLGKMFRNAIMVNGDLSSWDLSNITDMGWMFFGATAFNGNISSWDVSNVLDMDALFYKASSFNGDISSWNVGKVTKMDAIFYEAFAFNQDLSSWNISNVSSMVDALGKAAINLENYDNTLIGWAAQNVQSNVSLGATGLEYCLGEFARNKLINDNGWIITGDSKNCPQLPCGYITWTGNTDNNWNNAGNWNLGRIPLACDTVLIYTDSVNINGTPAVGTRLVNAGKLTIDGSLTLDGSLANSILAASPGTIENNGTLICKNAIEVAIQNDGAFINSGQLLIDQADGGLVNNKFFINGPAATVNIGNNGGNISATAIVNESNGLFINQGQLVADNITGVGIWNKHIVRNETGGNMNFGQNGGSISVYAISNNITGHFYNFGQITSTTSSPIDIYNNKVISGAGNWYGGGTLTLADRFENYGIISPGSSPGNIHINGDLDHNGSSIDTFEIAGLVGGGALLGHDSIYVDGDLEVRGKIVIKLLDNFSLNDQDQFVLFEYTGALSGTFSTVELPAPEMDGWLIDYNQAGKIILKKPSTQRPFITTWKTDEPGISNSTSITIPTFGSGYNYDVDWENDGIYDDFGVTSDITHDYGTAGTYQVAIRGDFPQINLYNGLNNKDSKKLMSVDQWGDIVWRSMNGAFSDCTNLTIPATDAPDLTNVTQMSSMFFNAISMNQDISHWDVSNVTDMGAMFYGAAAFNQDISGWDVSNVTSMFNMFNGASAFNQDISGWDVSKVTNMSLMFANATAFNQPLDNWNIGEVTNTSRMFMNADAFNQSLANWNTAKITNAQFMFLGADLFNQNLSAWDMSMVTNMKGMFSGAIAFNQNLADWNITSVANMDDMLNNTDISLIRYDSILIFWSLQNVQSNVPLGANGLEYCVAESFRNNLINNNGWTISGDSKSCPILPKPFLTTWKTDNPGNSNATSITIPINGFADYDVDWENDGIYDDFGITGTITHDYGVTGTYQVAIRGNINHLLFDNSGDKDKILSIDQWGDVVWDEMFGAFHGCSNLTSTATDAPDLSNVTITSHMFWDAVNFNADLSNWDVSNVTNMRGMFLGATAFNGDLSIWDVSKVEFMDEMFQRAENFNQDISGWNVSSVTNMGTMFLEATTFNQNISNWTVSNVTNMGFMFARAAAFNQDISNWNVGKVTNMAGMFQSANSFNQDISSWDVSKVTDMLSMFNANSIFNQDISDWNVGMVTDMRFMFSGASAFNQNLVDWNITNVTNMQDMLSFSNLSTENYDNTLIGWASQNVQSNVSFGALDLTYCNGETARNDLMNNHNWTISGDTKNCPIDCSIYDNLPNPILAFKRLEYYTVGSTDFIRYELEVTNYTAFPNELFEIDPNTNICGGRTDVDIFDNNGNYLNGFCAISSNAGLNQIWFALPETDCPADGVYIRMTDKDCNKNYFSNLLDLSPHVPAHCNSNVCGEDNLSITTIEHPLYHAVNTITSNATLANNESTVFKAGTTITLTEGFHAEGDFHALIEDCPDQNLVESVAESRHQAEESTMQAQLKTINKNDLKVYPNPTNGWFTVEINTTLPAQLQLFNSSGQLIETRQNVLDKTELNLQEQPTGIYFINIQDLSTGQHFYKKIIKIN